MRKVRATTKRANKYEAIASRHAEIEACQSGKGWYIYRNRTKGDLYLPKKTKAGEKVIQSGRTWEGDDYYMQLVKSHEATLVKVVTTPEEAKMQEQKLILDQPDVITEQGAVERVLAPAPTELDSLNETPAKAPEQKEVLLTEDPLSGVQILLND